MNPSIMYSYNALLKTNKVLIYTIGIFVIYTGISYVHIGLTDMSCTGILIDGYGKTTNKWHILNNTGTKSYIYYVAN